MARMSGNEKSPSRYFGDSLQSTNYILVSGATCHMMPQVSNFIPDSLEDTDKNIEVADGHHVVAKKKVQKQVCLNESGDRASQKESKNGDNDNNQKIYASAA